MLFVDISKPNSFYGDGPYRNGVHTLLDKDSWEWFVRVDLSIKIPFGTIRYDCAPKILLLSDAGLSFCRGTGSLQDACPSLLDTCWYLLFVVKDSCFNMEAMHFVEKHLLALLPGLPFCRENPFYTTKRAAQPLLWNFHGDWNSYSTKNTIRKTSLWQKRATYILKIHFPNPPIIPRKTSETPIKFFHTQAAHHFFHGFRVNTSSPGAPVVSKATRAHPQLAMALTKGCRNSWPDFRFTSIQVTRPTDGIKDSSSW